MKKKMRIGAVLTWIAVFGSLLFTAPVQAAASASVHEAQTILTKFGLPVGSIDGLWGSQTARGLCAFRSIAGLPVNRNALTATDLTMLRGYNTKYTSLSQIPAPPLNAHSTYLLANQTCQTMAYVSVNKYVKVMAISTGMKGHATPNGNYTVGNTQRGWRCSTLYPESCATHAEGRFVAVSSYGNMYNKRSYSAARGLYVHGSTSVPAYPASHGCIRVTIGDSDWLYDTIGATYFSVVGAY